MNHTPQPLSPTFEEIELTKHGNGCTQRDLPKQRSNLPCPFSCKMNAHSEILNLIHRERSCRGSNTRYSENVHNPSSEYISLKRRPANKEIVKQKTKLGNITS